VQQQAADQISPSAVERAVRSVLVVDDSRAQRALLTRMLSRWGYAVQEAPSAPAALEICRAQAPDLVLSDWVMPEMDGLEFCRRFRAMRRECYGYFILLTSKTERDDMTRGFDAGADDFLSKPVRGAELRARLAAGERVLGMERELRQKNALVARTLGELQAAHDLLRTDLNEARKLQQSLVRETFRDFGIAAVSLAMRPLGHVGGDLVGMFPAGDQHVGVYGLDVSGHGVSSAMMTARLAGYLSSTAPEQNVALRIGRKGRARPRQTSETVTMLNDLILGEVETEHYFTMLLAILDLESGELEFTQAGHPCPLLRHADGVVEPLGSGGLPMGMLEGADYETVRVQLSSGDRLLIHSDGLNDYRLESGQFLGEEGLQSLVGQTEGQSGAEFLDALLWRLDDLGGANGPTDDISAVLLDIVARVPQ
jgi:sigma-B regulation protein RsbU (phosphoserine phosphatase)